jgi:hypothetical protein
MTVRRDRLVVKGPIKNQASARSEKSVSKATEWEVTDERLDEALRQTFPASDALSIVRKGSQ